MRIILGRGKNSWRGFVRWRYRIRWRILGRWGVGVLGCRLGILILRRLSTILMGIRSLCQNSMNNSPNPTSKNTLFSGYCSSKWLLLEPILKRLTTRSDINSKHLRFLTSSRLMKESVTWNCWRVNSSILWRYSKRQTPNPSSQPHPRPWPSPTPTQKSTKSPQKSNSPQNAPPCKKVNSRKKKTKEKTHPYSRL